MNSFDFQMIVLRSTASKWLSPYLTYLKYILCSTGGIILHRFDFLFWDFLSMLATWLFTLSHHILNPVVDKCIDLQIYLILMYFVGYGKKWPDLTFPFFCGVGLPPRYCYNMNTLSGYLFIFLQKNYLICTANLCGSIFPRNFLLTRFDFPLRCGLGRPPGSALCAVISKPDPPSSR